MALIQLPDSEWGILAFYLWSAIACEAHYHLRSLFRRSSSAIRRSRWWVDVSPGWRVDVSPGWWVDVSPGWWVDVSPGWWVDVSPSWWVDVSPGWWVDVSPGWWVDVSPGWWVDVSKMLTLPNTLQNLDAP